jgi:hypothetical protein
MFFQQREYRQQADLQAKLQTKQLENRLLQESIQAEWYRQQLGQLTVGPSQQVTQPFNQPAVRQTQPDIRQTQPVRQTKMEGVRFVASTLKLQWRL